MEYQGENEITTWSGGNQHNDSDYYENDDNKWDKLSEENPGVDRFSYIMKTCYKYVLGSGLQLVGLVYSSSYLQVKIIPYQLELIIRQDDKYGLFCILNFIGKQRLINTFESQPWFKREIQEPADLIITLKHISQFQQQYKYARHKYRMLEL